MDLFGELNMILRSQVIEQVLRLEQAATITLKTMLRMFKKKTKTLGNQNSALSFKAKVDLLYDLNELNDEEYNHLIKIMEIRNQFAHNTNAISFEAFDEINPSINKYLEKYKTKVKTKKERESELFEIFSYLSTVVLIKLTIIREEYHLGMGKEYEKYLNDLVVENLEVIWKRAIELDKSYKVSTLPPIGFFPKDPKEFESFYGYFKLAMLEFHQKELDKIGDKDFEKIFKQKVQIIKTEKKK